MKNQPTKDKIIEYSIYAGLVGLIIWVIWHVFADGHFSRLLNSIERYAHRPVADFKAGDIYLLVLVVFFLFKTAKSK